MGTWKSQRVASFRKIQSARRASVVPRKKWLPLGLLVLPWPVGAGTSPARQVITASLFPLDLSHWWISHRGPFYQELPCKGYYASSLSRDAAPLNPPSGPSFAAQLRPGRLKSISSLPGVSSCQQGCWGAHLLGS